MEQQQSFTNLFDKEIRRRLEKQYGQVWNSNEMHQEFEILKITGSGFVVERRADGKRGSMDYLPSPLFYFDFQAY